MRNTIRTASINHNDENRRIKLNLVKSDRGYVWQTAIGEDCGLPVVSTVGQAINNAKAAWGHSDWAMKAKWL